MTAFSSTVAKSNARVMPVQNKLKEMTRRILPSGAKLSHRPGAARLTPWLLAAASGLMLTASFPGWGLAPLAWFALIPLTYGVLRHPESAFRQGFVTGVLFYWTSLFWLRHVTLGGMFALGTYLALYPAVWAWGLARLRSRFNRTSGSHHLALAAVGAAGWTGLEWLRGWLMTGFPWNLLGVSQYQNIALIQIAEVTGVYGVSYILVFTNIALLTGIRRMAVERFAAGKWRFELTAALLLIAVTMAWGMMRFFRIRNSDTLPRLRVTMIQPNVPQSLKWEPAHEKKARRDLRNLTLSSAPSSDLVVWPETALTSDPSHNPAAAEYLDGVLQAADTALLIGTIRRDDLDPSRFHNSAILVQPGANPLQSYHKRHLVPFGEYVPLESTLPFLKKLTPIEENFGPGSGPQLLHLNHDATIGVLICFEDVFPALARESSSAGANLLVNITNDGWFGTSDEQVQHAANASFRAVENRVPLVRAANNGLTCVVAPTGVITSMLRDPDRGVHIEGRLTAEIRPAEGGPTPYTRYGDWFAIGCLAVSAAWTAASLPRPILSRKGLHSA